MDEHKVKVTLLQYIESTVSKAVVQYFLETNPEGYNEIKRLFLLKLETKDEEFQKLKNEFPDYNLDSLSSDIIKLFFPE
ncbi:hypothetical protein [Sebaldella sp. S0638]|uniref:hypothetical protein n=1 Tax=Sebaldella sp. S0638 TaxID=2957809 RepID=UPI00209EA381|nr:hypothetical protein [Sebaldella sp. S0638]MCP1226701.1 hypothetical protein [Sebaldella sp. S0638]